MLQTTGAQFAQNHKIHFSAPIETTVGIPLSDGRSTAWLFEDTTYIDFNENGKPDVTGTNGWNRGDIWMTEHAFMTDYQSLKNIAKDNETEIIRNQDVTPVHMARKGVSVAKWFGQHKTMLTQQGTLAGLVAGVTFPQGVDWAIDVANNTFMVYSDKE